MPDSCAWLLLLTLVTLRRHIISSLVYRLTFPPSSSPLLVPSLSPSPSSPLVVAYYSPSVFSFFLPEYAPAGPVSDAGLRAPEAQLGTSPLTIAFLNGMNSLIRFGLTECFSGLGPWWNKPQGGAFPDINRNCWERAADTSDGKLTFAVTGGESSATTGATVVAELDVLLTAGRLTVANRHMIAAAYDDIVTAGTTSACNTCKAGAFELSSAFGSHNGVPAGGSNGGVLLVGGTCQAWCSPAGSDGLRRCGTGSTYKTSGSTDCRSDGVTDGDTSPATAIAAVVIVVVLLIIAV